MDKQLRLNLSSIFLLIAFIGIIGFMYNVAAAPSRSGSNEFPLVDVEGISSDSHNNIYIGLEFYTRIQKYNQNGQFLKSWYVEADQGVFNFYIS